MTSKLRTGLAALFVLVAVWAHAMSAPQAQTAGKGTTLTATSTNVSGSGRAVKINVLRWSTDEERNALVVAMNPPPPPAAGAGRGRGGRGAGGAGRGAAAGGDAAADDAAAGGAAARGAAGGRGRGRGDGAPAAPPRPLASLAAAIEKAPTVGYLWMGDSNIGYSIHYAFRASTADGGERIILATNRRLGEADASWNPAAPATPTDYDFSLIEVRLDPKGLGEGKASINTKVVADADAKTIALDNYGASPVVLKSVKR
jgi:hypothetical protein